MIVCVAAGVLRRPDGQILLAQRPEGKIAAGRWEFPGGKIESDETAPLALARELAEEIGIVVKQARPLIRLRHAYTERTVELDTWLVSEWQGEPQGLEGQALAWSSAEDVADRFDILEADVPILNALCLPEALPITGAFRDVSDLLQRSGELFRQGHTLLRLRAPQLDDQEYIAAAEQLARLAAGFDAGIVVDRIEAARKFEGVAGLQLRGSDLHLLDRPLKRSYRWLFASVHNAKDIAMAQAGGVDALVLGAVCPTQTHPDQSTLGWAEFSRLLEEAHVPVYAIGGMEVVDISRAQAAGAQGIAAIRAYW
ncbi:MAG: Nudix family hydrolase [Oceanococcus sp.]